MSLKSIKQILMAKGVHYLYHANTVATSCTFIKNGGLFSREAIEKRNLYQTYQKSDQTDKIFDVYNDIFFDSIDIHESIRRINFYGPVLFVYTIDILDTIPDNFIKITKSNPIYWDYNTKEKDKYFNTNEELEALFQKGNFQQHITLKNQHTPLPFDHLEKIILDNPGEKHEHLFEKALSVLQQTIKKTYSTQNFRSTYLQSIL